MNNVCNRKCLWNYNNQCCPETDNHYKDGTAHTKKCSQFLHKDFETNMINVLEECKDLIWRMSLKDLKKARHALKQIKDNKESFSCGGYCQVCKHTSPCEAKRQKEVLRTL